MKIAIFQYYICVIIPVVYHYRILEQMNSRPILNLTEFCPVKAKSSFIVSICHCNQLLVDIKEIWFFNVLEIWIRAYLKVKGEAFQRLGDLIIN